MLKTLSYHSSLLALKQLKKIFLESSAESIVKTPQKPWRTPFRAKISLSTSIHQISDDEAYPHMLLTWFPHQDFWKRLEERSSDLLNEI